MAGRIFGRVRKLTLVKVQTASHLLMWQESNEERVEMAPSPPPLGFNTGNLRDSLVSFGETALLFIRACGFRSETPFTLINELLIRIVLVY